MLTTSVAQVSFAFGAWVVAGGAHCVHCRNDAAVHQTSNYDASCDVRSGCRRRANDCRAPIAAAFRGCLMPLGGTSDRHSPSRIICPDPGMTPCLTPYGAVSPGPPRTESLCERRNSEYAADRLRAPADARADELENRRGRQAPGGSNPSPSATNSLKRYRGLRDSRRCLRGSRSGSSPTSTRRERTSGASRSGSWGARHVDQDDAAQAAARDRDHPRPAGAGRGNCRAVPPPRVATAGATSTPLRAWVVGPGSASRPPMLTAYSP